MKCSIYIIVFSVFFSAAGLAAQNSLDSQVWEAWHDAKNSVYSKEPADAGAIAEAGASLKNMVLSQNKEEGKQSIANELVDFTTALAWAKAGDLEQATKSFAAEAATQAALKRDFLENTRQPAAFAVDVFSLHSLLLANDPQAKNIPNLGYQFFELTGADGKKSFIFVYGSDNEFQSEFTTEGIEADEQKKMIYLFGVDAEGRYSVLDRAQVIAERSKFGVMDKKTNGQFSLILDGIRKVINYKPNSNYPEVKTSSLQHLELQIDNGKIEQPLAAIERIDKGEAAPHRKTDVGSDALALETNSSKDHAVENSSLPENSKIQIVGITIAGLVCITGFWLIWKRRNT